ncbi:anthranilate synthase component II [Flavobacterium aciduliphilum]|uniref:Anthranilate synthase component 2 n=1 Tax=Flavobacterium aciduliphilum TaxID=1101402 RepID=A0A328YJM8_9FLAO|nr:aminodeoxychorismate/anthranilate synthase component II [Flavobacterium aciduliphilum]RAR70797.1 anthranilate synthase component 2 [Flavobacterium aciduliphilum]
MEQIVLIDNYDSFTFNLVHYLEALNCSVTVFRNDRFDLDVIDSFDKIILSPGPGIPSDAGLLKDVITKYAPTKKILGICLGHQAIGEVFGAQLENLDTVYHGVSSGITLTTDDVLFKNLPKNITVGRYHSWVISSVNFPKHLEITSVSEEGFIMSIRHKYYPVFGVQFHPESILTPLGKEIIANWMRL